MLMKLIFESQGRVKIAGKWLHENGNISFKKLYTANTFFNIDQKINSLESKKLQDLGNHSFE